MSEIITKASGLWPSATPDQLEVLNRIFDGVPETRAIRVLEEAYSESQYSKLPIKLIKKKAAYKSTQGRIQGNFIETWAVHQETKKYRCCMVLASNDEGAKVQMEKYLQNVCRANPFEWVLFVGENSQQNALRYRIN